MTSTFEFVLHFVKCYTVTVSPIQLIIIIICSSIGKKVFVIKQLLIILVINIGKYFAFELYYLFLAVYRSSTQKHNNISSPKIYSNVNRTNLTICIIIAKCDIPDRFTIEWKEEEGRMKNDIIIPVYRWHTFSKQAQRTKNCEGLHSVRLFNRVLRGCPGDWFLDSVASLLFRLHALFLDIIQNNNSTLPGLISVDLRDPGLLLHSFPLEQNWNLTFFTVDWFFCCCPFMYFILLLIRRARQSDVY